MDYTAGATEERLAPFALNYRLVGPMMREVARLNFEGRLKAVAEANGRPTETLHIGDWDAAVSYGAVRNRAGAGNPSPIGRVLVAQLKRNQFLVAGLHCRVEFRFAGADSAKQRQYLRVEEGVYEKGVFKMIRIWNGDETDWGLNFGATPVVLRVSVATY
jgi:hypothetical protein